MKCPKCGADIPFYDLKPNCRECGVNILFYTQDYDLERDAKRTELENASARMVIARIKTVFIGSLSAILRMVFTILSICALMIPFGSVVFKLPFYEEKFSIGLINVIQSFSDGMLLSLPNYLKSTMFSSAALCTVIVLAFFTVLTVVDAVILVTFILSFLNPEKSAKIMKRTSIIACVISLLTQAAVVICVLFVMEPLVRTPYYNCAQMSIGFGAAACFALHLVVVIINAKMLKKGITPVYREFDPKRKELLKQFKKGEIDLDDLPLPVFESEEEYQTRMSEFEHAMEEEAAAELEAEVQAAAKAKEEANTR